MWLSSVQIRPLFCLRVGDTDLGRGTYWKVYSQPGCAYSVIYIISTWLVVRLACHWVTFSSSLVLGVPKMLLGFLPVLCRLVIIHIYIYIINVLTVPVGARCCGNIGFLLDFHRDVDHLHIEIEVTWLYDIFFQHRNDVVTIT